MLIFLNTLFSFYRCADSVLTSTIETFPNTSVNPSHNSRKHACIASHESQIDIVYTDTLMDEEMK